MRFPFLRLSRRERQVLDSVYRRGKATVEEVRSDLPDPPTAAAVRATLLRLADGGHVIKEPAGPRNVFAPARSGKSMKRSVLRHVIETFFGGSPERVVTAILEDGDFTEEELRRYEKLIEEAKRRKGCS